MSLTKSQTKSNTPTERIAILRSGHGREDGSTFTTSASFIVSSDGAKLLAGRHITKRAASALERNAEAFERESNVRPFPQRPRPTSPASNRREAA